MTQTSDQSCGDSDPADISQKMDIINKRGLHARASAKFVKCAGSFDAQITVSREGQTVKATSIMGLMMLGAGIGTHVTVCAKGPQASEAMKALAELVDGKFGEEC